MKNGVLGKFFLKWSKDHIRELMRISLGVIFLWFGALKVFNVSPVYDFVVTAYPIFSYKGMFFIIEQDIAKEKIFSLTEPIDLIKKKKIKRVVLDSLTLFKFVYPKNELDFRNGVLDFILTMRELNITLMVTSEKGHVDIDAIKFDPQDFLFGGLIILTKVRRGSSFERVMMVSKMRGQNHLLDIFPFLIGEGGVTIFTKQLPFSLMNKDDEKKH